MLRFGFLPSDFHPMLLMLGDAADFAELAALLRRYAAARAPLRLEAQGFARAAAGTQVLLTPEGGTPGLWRIMPEAPAFRWTLDARLAAGFAAQAAAVAAPGLRAGSELLEAGARGEVPVKLSRGEYTDDFLRDD